MDYKKYFIDDYILIFDFETNKFEVQKLNEWNGKYYTVANISEIESIISRFIKSE